MKTSTIGILIIILIGIVLFATNPTQSEFNSFVQENLKNELSKTAETNWLYGALKAVLPQQTEALVCSTVESMTKHEDYYVFSLFKMNLPEMQLTYVGVGSKFFMIKRVEQSNATEVES